MIELSWVSTNTRYGPTVYKMLLNGSIRVATVSMSAAVLGKYGMVFGLPEPVNCKSDVFKATSILFNSKEDAMDACENMFCTWLKESKILEEK